MPRTITVKGIGKTSAKPDYVELSMTLQSNHMDYDKAMDMAAGHIQDLNDALAAIGFEQGAIKTTDFNVRTIYNHALDHDEVYKNVFNGYEVTHQLKLAFDFDMGKLSQALAAISNCPSHPQLSVAFTVKDATAINEEMLRSATANAKRKAEILCEASGVTMGDLIAIDYNWGELDIYSHTRYDCCEDTMPLMAKSIDIDPDDIDVSDTATFVWVIQ